MKKFFQDFRHLLWLAKQMIVLGFKGGWEGSYEAWLFLRIHWLYQRKRVR